MLGADRCHYIMRWLFGTAIIIAILAVPRDTPLAASRPQVVSTAALGQVYDVEIANGDWPAYASTSTGLYRAVSRTYTLWQKQNALSAAALAPNPRNPADLLFTRGGVGVFRSLNGGQTARRVLSCFFLALTRSPQSPNVIYGGTRISDAGLQCGKPLPPGWGAADYLDRSTDDGLTWTTVYTSANGYDLTGGIGPIAVSPHDPAHVLAAVTWDRNSGDLMGSDDGGTTWTKRYYIPLDGVAPTAIAFDPTDANSVWSAWGIGGLLHSADGGQTWHTAPLDGLAVTSRRDGNIPASVLAHASVDALSIDPLSGRVYARVVIISDPYNDTQRGVIFAVSPQGHVDRFAPSLERVTPFGDDTFPRFTLTRRGDMVTWCPARCTTAPPLTIRPVIGAGNWNVSSVFSGTKATWAQHVLGQPLSPTDTCTDQPCQYFDKGALATTDQSGYTVLPLVPRLLTARLSSPVGGSSSTVTYKTLNALHSQRTPPPAGFAGGTMAVPGGTFVPYSATLAPVSGYVVPAYFWRYLSSSYASPDGWQQDVGLPLTPAVAATVRKGTLGTRHIMVQAFQRAVLTYDPRNPAPFQVERANIGADFAAAFPQAVR